jgi:hypothetical protein
MSAAKGGKAGKSESTHSSWISQGFEGCLNMSGYCGGFKVMMEDHEGHQEEVLDAGTTGMVVAARIGDGHQTKEEETCSDNPAGTHWSTDIALHKCITNI